MTASGPVTRGPRRAPILALVAIALVAGVVAGRGSPPRSFRLAAPIDAAQLPPAGALSTAWYCPGLPKSFATADQTLTLANLGATETAAIVTVQPDDGSAPVSRTLSVPPQSVRTFSRARLEPKSATVRRKSKRPAPLPLGPIVVQPFASSIAVSAGIETSGALDTVPCATSAGKDWYFAAGTTVRGVSQWLVLDNPFATDARVDVTLRTDGGVQLLPALQGIDVPGRSRVIIGIHDAAVRQARVSVEAHAALGQIVAAQTLQFGADSGPTGIATSLGALAPSTAWWFTAGDARAGATQWIAIADISQLDAHVDVQAFVASKAVVQPVVLTVRSGGVSWVQIGACARKATTCLRVPDRGGFEIKIESDATVPIIAQSLGRFGIRASALGAATSVGSTAPARRWVFARTLVTAERATSIALMNATASPARVSVEVIGGGQVERPASLQHITVAAGQHLALPLEAVRLHRVDTAVTVTSDVPIFAESTIFAERDVTRAPGIPAR